jgi:carbamoyltransferase
MRRYYIGLASTFHDPALAILDDSGNVLFAESTERYLQNKRAYNAPPDDLLRLPALLREHCAADAEFVAAVTWSGAFLDHLGFLAATAIRQPTESDRNPLLAWPAMDSRALTLALRNSLSQAGLNLTASWHVPGHVRIKRYDHHLTHAAAAAFSSPFEECVVAVVDGYGETGSTACYHFQRGRLTRLDAPILPTAGDAMASLGHLYSLICAGCGFDPWRGEEWKVMGLAGYGRRNDEMYDLLRPLVAVSGLSLTSGCSIRAAGDAADRLRRLQRAEDSSPLAAADLAHTGQLVFEEVMTELLHNLARLGLSTNVALGGGCALNSSFNGKIVERTPFRAVHVPPAPADDGNAIGAAYLAWSDDHDPTGRKPRRLRAYLGSAMSDLTVEHLRRHGGWATHSRHPGTIHQVAARLLAEGRIVGWIQGRAEFGPRALGNRSILADPRLPDMHARINAEVKYRERFRPLAPAVLDQLGAEWFESYQTSPYMERALRFRPERAALVPAVVHTDGTGRVQSVRRAWNPLFHDLICEFYRLTDVPLVLNTSYNIMGKPIVHSVEDALGVFLTSGIDALVIGDDLWRKPSCAQAFKGPSA